MLAGLDVVVFLALVLAVRIPRESDSERHARTRQTRLGEARAPAESNADAWEESRSREPALSSFGGPEKGLATGEDDMERVWQMDKLSRLRTTLSKLAEEKKAEWTIDDLTLYLQQYKRRKPSTIRKRILQLEMMRRHPAMPVVLDGTREDVVNSFTLYVTYREQEEGVGHGGLINDHKAIRSLGDFLSIPREVWPTMPTPPAGDLVELPSPEQVYELLHTDYLPNPKRSYENALLRYLMAFDFGYGIRFPSEVFALQLHDVNLEQGTITVTEPKKNGKKRRLLVEPEWLLTSKRHMSLENWLRWRDKVDPTTAAFFPREDGTAFPSADAVRKRLYDTVVPRFPWFNPYLGRHWSVNARLIEWEYDYVRVSQWHGHDSVNMTKNTYEHSARLHERLHGGGWLKRAFEKPRCTAQGPKNG